MSFVPSVTSAPLAPSTHRLRALTAVVVAAAGTIATEPIVTTTVHIGTGAVTLTADAYSDLVTNTLANLNTITTNWLTEPFPILNQTIDNWIGYGQLTFDTLVATGQSFVYGLANLPSQLETVFSALRDGEFGEVLAMAIIITISIDPLLGMVDQLMSIPYNIAADLVSGAMATLYALQVPAGLAAVGALNATVTETMRALQDLVDQLQSGDLPGALIEVFEAPAQILDATLNSDAAGSAGLLSPLPELNQMGLVEALVNYLPQSVAQAIIAPYLPDEPGDTIPFDAAP